MRLSLHFLCTLCVLLISAAAHAEGGDTYTGTIGTHAIVMQLDTHDATQIEGRYFYVLHRRDVPLEGKAAAADHLVLTEGPAQDEARKPQLDLTKQPDGGWSGTWREPKGASLAVHLLPAKAPSTPADAGPYLQALQLKNIYEYLRLSGLRLHAGKREQVMGHHLQWWVEPDSKITLFEVLDGYAATQLQAINQVLRDRLWREVAAFHECMLGGSRWSGGGDFEQSVTPRLLSAHAVSVSVFTSYSCGGAHPDFGDSPINLDTTTAKPLTLEDVLWLGHGAPFHYVDGTDPDAPPQPAIVGFDTYSAYRQKSLAVARRSG